MSNDQCFYSREEDPKPKEEPIKVPIIDEALHYFIDKVETFFEQVNEAFKPVSKE